MPTPSNNPANPTPPTDPAPPPPSAPPSPAALNEQVIDEFRTRSGRVGGMFEGVPLLLLTTTGARSGRLHTTPVVYAHDKGRLLVFASHAGGPRHPAWYHNLLADPRVSYEIGTDDGRVTRFAATAEPLRGTARERAYEEQCARDPAFTAYREATTREIPVIALHRPDITDPARTRAMGEFLLRVHGELRDQLASLTARFTTDTDTDIDTDTVPAPGTAAARPLALHCLTLCTALHGHHTHEDGAFTDLALRFPELAPAIARLRREHTRVAATVQDIERLARHLDTNPADRSPLRAELLALTADLERHFAYEEEQLLPTLFAATDTR
ncbi:nitroreductase/quinone reductase family protein [Streptomyces sp. NPDC093252]|uniref:nitroreductase/quinone reductase family protein n=1 Tax=Streptomyces sp. NPDC093252 TaxID=3154980 RepID=UPI00342B6A30